MEVNGRIRDAYRTASGTTIINLEAESIGSDEELDNLIHEDRLRCVFERYKARRSLNANAYLWVLVDKIAKKLKIDKWQVYIKSIKDYGIFVDIAILDEAIPHLRQMYREIEVIDQGEMNGKKASYVRCYIGSSQYSKEEMKDLIDGVVEDAKSLGIDVLPPDELAHIISVWKGNFNEF